jgi:hypothetical protein
MCPVCSQFWLVEQIKPTGAFWRQLWPQLPRPPRVFTVFTGLRSRISVLDFEGKWYQSRVWSDGSGVGAKMNFQPSWNIAHWCFLPDVKCCSALAIVRHRFSGFLFAVSVGRDHLRLGDSPITPKFYAATLASDLKTSIYIVALIFLTGTATEDLSVLGATV